MNKEEYKRRKKQLEDIENIYGISMGFQKGILDSEANIDNARSIPTENSPIYTDYHAGLKFGLINRHKRLIKA